MNIKREIAAIERRAAASDATLADVIERAGMARSTVWRALQPDRKTESGKVRVVRRLKAALAAIEVPTPREEKSK